MVDYGKTKVGRIRNQTIHQISFEKVRMTANYRIGSEHTHRNGTIYVGRSVTANLSTPSGFGARFKGNGNFILVSGTAESEQFKHGTSS